MADSSGDVRNQNTESTKNKSTQLISTICRSDYNAIKKLINTKIDINEKDSNGRIALMHACVNPEFDSRMIKLLIDKGANINEKDHVGRTILMYVCADPKFNLSTIKSLVDYGSDVNATDANNMTMIMYAILNIGMARFFNIKEQDETIKSINQTISSMIERSNRTEINFELIDWLIDKGVDINAQSIDGMSALHLACIRSETNLINFLINKGADVNVKDMNGRTPLMFACLNNRINLQTIQLLIEKGADINAEDNERISVLTYAILDVTMSRFLNIRHQTGYKKISINDRNNQFNCATFWSYDN